MPTPIAFTIADLDAEIMAANDKWTNRSDYTTLRDRAYRKALAEYNDDLVKADDPFVRASVMSAPITLGAAKIDTTVGDVFQVTLPSDAMNVAGDAILVQKSATAEFDNVPRMSWADIVASGTGQTPYAFWENDGVIYIYTKDGNFDATASVVFDYYRKLDATQTPTSTPLDIKQNGFGTILDTTAAFLEAYI